MDMRANNQTTEQSSHLNPQAFLSARRVLRGFLAFVFLPRITLAAINPIRIF
jgi:hypothetical protein